MCTIVDESPESQMLRLEEAFSIHSQERILGLLGAMIPPENHVKVAIYAHKYCATVNFKCYFIDNVT
jgi:hypothetical protein